MFDQLTDVQESGTTKKKSVVVTVSVVFHVILIVFAIILPMLFPETLGGVGTQLTFLVAPPPPPPPPPPPAATEVVKRVRTAPTTDFTAPVEIPQDILMVVDEGPAPEAMVAGVVGGVPGGVPGGVLGGVVGGVIGGAPTSLAPPPPPPPPPPPKPPQRIRVGGNVQRANLIRQVRPRYPALAKQARIQGTVILEAIISKQGSVENLRVVKGHPLLIQSALNAVKQWRYKPTVLNGVPVEVITRITVNFNLRG